MTWQKRLDRTSVSSSCLSSQTVRGTNIGFIAPTELHPGTKSSQNGSSASQLSPDSTDCGSAGNRGRKSHEGTFLNLGTEEYISVSTTMTFIISLTCNTSTRVPQINAGNLITQKIFTTSWLISKSDNPRAPVRQQLTLAFSRFLANRTVWLFYTLQKVKVILRYQQISSSSSSSSQLQSSQEVIPVFNPPTLSLIFRGTWPLCEFVLWHGAKIFSLDCTTY